MDDTLGKIVDAPAKPVRPDQKLLLFISAFVLIAPIASYFATRYSYVGVTFLLGFASLIIYGFTICVFLVRCFSLNLRKLSRSLISVVLLAILPLSSPVEQYLIDQIRFHMHRSFYFAAVKKSISDPKFVTFDWGSSGFAGMNDHYFLVFSESGGITRGNPDPKDLLMGPDSSSVCRGSVTRLWDHFYSVGIAC